MRVLVAEDDPVSRRILEVTLRKWNYDVVSVPDGNQALEILQHEDAPRMALLDWMMPEKDGPEVCRQLRARPSKRYTYIILLTNRSGKEDVVEGLEAGADDYVVKPFEAVELKARMLAGTRIIELQDQLLAVQEKLRHQATHDALTGVLSRGAILDKLKIEFHRANRQSDPLTLIMADIDCFKLINDNFGHQIGDTVLKNVAQTMSHTVRIYDAVGRYGGEEFLIVAPACDTSTAKTLADRLHSQIRRHTMMDADSQVMVTCSFGVVTTSGEQGSFEALIRCADKALYRAKANGRDRVEVSDQS